MNDKIEIKPQVISPLKKICMSIGELPTSYLETMTYYEMLVWFTNYLRDTVIPVVNNNGEAVTELQNLFVELQSYVNDYFDNLDVQEEINNKLDDMLEDGQLEQIIEQYIQSAALWCFDTVAIMKESTNLINGSYAKTLGYYSKDDGGQAIYKIASTHETGDHYETLTNGLYAILIVENDINIKQFGAYGDGTHDDTTAFTSAITYLKNIFLNSNSAERLSLILGAGNYLISSTIQIPVYLKLIMNDNVMITSTVSSGATLWINSDNFTLVQGTTDYIGFNLDKDLIGGTGSLSIARSNMWDDVNNAESTSIGLLIGDDTYNSNYMKIARFTIQHVNITGFNTAIKLNEKNTYFLTFEHCHFELNRHSFVYGTTTETASNSGENISFYRCIFATSYNAIVNNKANGDGGMNFNECSFDFNGNVLLLNKGSHVVFNTCHFEGVGYTDNTNLLTNESNTTGFGTIVYNNYVANHNVHNSIVEIISPNLYLASSNIKHLFESIDSSSYYPLIVKFDSKQLILYKQYNFNNVLLNDPNTIVEEFDCRLKNAVTPSMVYDRNDTIGTMSAIPNDANMTSIQSYDLKVVYGSSMAMDTTTKMFNKSMKVTISGVNALNVERTLYNFNKDRIFTTMYYKLACTGVSDTLSRVQPIIEIYYYNEAGTEVAPKVRIAQDQAQHIYHNTTTDWYVLKPIVANVPKDCYKMKIVYMLSLRNASNTAIQCNGDIYIDGLLVN